MIAEKCGAQVIKPGKIFHYVAFTKSGTVSAVFGGYIGMLLDSRYLGGTRSNINKTNFSTTLARIILTFSLIALLISPYFCK
jgi:hypothetical protein